MADVNLPYTLTAGQPENVNQLNANLNAIVSELNGNLNASNIAASGVGTSEIADGAVTTVKVADANVTKAKLATDALNNFLKLATAADRKVAFGTFSSGSFGNGKTASGTVTHGLGATPALVVLCAGAINTQTPSSSAVAASWDGTVNSTSFGWRLTIADGGVSNNGVTVYWLAIA